MRKLSILTFMTLDGVMQAPVQPGEDLSGGFQNGGWAAEHFNEVMPQVNEYAMAEPFDILFGRKTYDIFASHWPDAPDSSHGNLLNKATKYVATSSPACLCWENSHPITGDIIAGIRDLKSLDGPIIQVHGSWKLIQTLLANDLVDEFRLWTFPVLVGPGKQLFSQGGFPGEVKLMETDATQKGVVMTIYERCR